MRVQNDLRGRVSALLALGIVAGLSPTGCVWKVQYERCVSEADQARALSETRDKANALRIGALEADLAAAQGAVQERDAKVSELSTVNHNTQSQVDEATAINQQLRGELMRLGKDVDKMLSERGTISKALDDAKARLDELRKAQALAQTRIDLFREFARRFKPLVDAGQMRIDVRRGQPVLQVAGDLLFDSSRSDLRPTGKGALMEIAHALQMAASQANGRRFLVTSGVDAQDGKEGQTRPAPKGSKSIANTWELTAARSVAVVEYLVSLGVPASSLTVAAAGAFDPVVANDSEGGRARNRRVEIALLPSEGEILAVPTEK